MQAQLRKDEPGPRFVHLPQALVEEKGPHPFFEQVTAEDRKPDGKWVKSKKRNEALDLMVMAHVAALATKVEKVDWTSPPDWARDWDANVNVEQTGATAPTVVKAPEPAPVRRRGLRGRVRI